MANSSARFRWSELTFRSSKVRVRWRARRKNRSAYEASRCIGDNTWATRNKSIQSRSTGWFVGIYITVSKSLRSEYNPLHNRKKTVNQWWDLGGFPQGQHHEKWDTLGCTSSPVTITTRTITYFFVGIPSNLQLCHWYWKDVNTKDTQFCQCKKMKLSRNCVSSYIGFHLLANQTWMIILATQN